MTSNRFTAQWAARHPSAQLASAAIELGLPVFACQADKVPIGKWGEEATTDEATIRRMFSDQRAVMIGMPTGQASGVTVVDVDVKNGARGQEWLDANRSRLPQTRTHKTRSGGLHLIFEYVPGIRNSASRIAPGVDVRGEGGFVVVPPSPGYSVADDHLPAIMPEWLIEAALPKAAPPSPPAEPGSRVSARPRANHHDGTPYGLSALEDECRAIAYAAQGTKHATLNKGAFAIGGLVTAGELNDSAAYSALVAALDEMHSRSPCKDFRAAQRTLARAYQDGKGRPRAVPEYTPPPSEPIEEHPAAEFLAAVRADFYRTRIQPIAVAPGIMDVDGVLKMFLDYCQASAISPQPFLALAAGICLVGTLAGRQYRTSTDLRTNIYAVGVADSGAGKDHARKTIKRVLHAAGLTRYLGGEDLASGSAIYTALSRHPAMLFQIDEFGDWLGEVLGPKAAPHRKQIAQRLKTLYSSAGSFLAGTEYADQSKAGRPREDIQEPHACLYGTSTPGQFWKSIQSGSLHDGLMARLLIFVSPLSYPDEQDPQNVDVPPALIEGCQAIASGIEGGGNLAAILMPDIAGGAYTVPESPAATAARQEMRRHQLETQRQHEGTYVTAIAGRLAENAMKLALVRAVSRHPQAPQIEEADVLWGRAVAQHCVDTLLKEAEQNVADTEFQARINHALKVLRAHGPCTMRDMDKHGFRYPQRERKEVMDTLIENEIVAVQATQHKGAGRPTVRYALTGL